LYCPAKQVLCISYRDTIPNIGIDIVVLYDFGPTPHRYWVSTINSELENLFQCPIGKGIPVEVSAIFTEEMLGNRSPTIQLRPN
jgi:hypothetical protein